MTRQLTEWELKMIQGQRALSVEELAKLQGDGAKAVPQEELQRRQIEQAKLMQNHTWPWEESK